MYGEKRIPFPGSPDKEKLMAGYFEALKKYIGKEELIGAWVISGENAGDRTLYAVRDDRLQALSTETVFLKHFRDSIQERSIAVIFTGNGSENQKGSDSYSGSGHSMESAARICRGGTALVCFEERQIFLERISGRRSLVICGAGHVSMPVIRMGKMLDFDVTVIEDREGYAQRARDAGADHVLCMPFEEALDKVRSDLSTAFVIVTRAHIHDVECLRKILNKPRAYVGMMGSRHRAGMIREQFTQEGYASELEHLHMPIGLAIASETPEEIAVSIMAEIILTMNSVSKGTEYPAGMLEELMENETANRNNEKYIERNKGPLALAVIVKKTGEAPRNPGTKMLVRSDGSFLGTVGGGSAEAWILDRAKKMIAENSPAPVIADIRLETEDGDEEMLYCGGEIVAAIEIARGTS